MTGTGPPLAELAHDLDAVEIGHDDVEQHDVGADLLGLLERLLAAARGDDAETFVVRVSATSLVMRGSSSATSTSGWVFKACISWVMWDTWCASAALRRRCNRHVRISRSSRSAWPGRSEPPGRRRRHEAPTTPAVHRAETQRQRPADRNVPADGLPCGLYVLRPVQAPAAGYRPPGDRRVDRPRSTRSWPRRARSAAGSWFFKLLKRARQLQIGLPPLTQTRYINTISPRAGARLPR